MGNEDEMIIRLWGAAAAVALAGLVAWVILSYLAS